MTKNSVEFVGGGVYMEQAGAFTVAKDAKVTGNEAGDGEGADTFTKE
jgi:hypothetical protein